MNLSMRDIMSALCQVDGAPMLTSNQCQALADQLNKMAGWQPMETLPRDGTSALVLLPEDGRSYRPRFHSAQFKEKGKGVSVIGDAFAFDRPEPVAWAYPPSLGDL